MKKTKTNIIRKKNVNLELIEKTFNNKHNINDIKNFIQIPSIIKLKSKESNISTNYGLFNSDIIHSMIYTTTFLKKYNDLSIPIQTYREYKYMLDDWKIKMYKNNLTIHSNSIWTLVNLYNNMFYILTPHVIIWHSLEQHYIHPNFDFYLRLSLAGKSRFIMIKLTLIPNEYSSHANVIIYDKKLNKVIRFEPYGVNDIVDGDNLDNKIKSLFKNATQSKVHYIRPSDYLKKFIWQTVSHDSEEDNKVLGDPVGYCLAWCYWFIDLKMKDPDMSELELMKKAIGNIQSYSKNIGNKYLIHIRNYAKSLDGLKNKFMININIPNMAHYKNSYSNNHLNDILDSIEKDVYDNISNKF